MEQHYDPENAASIGNNDGNGIESNNRTQIPNHFNEMTEENMNAVDPTITEDCTTNAGVSNSAAPVSDETGTPEPFAPISSPGSSDEAVGQTNTNGDSEASESPSSNSESVPPTRKRGWPKGKARKKPLPEVTADVARHPPVEKVTPTFAPDPFDPANLKIRARDSGITVKKVLTTIPAKKKPGRQDFVRTRAGADWQVETLIIEDEKANNYYAVMPALHDHLAQKGFTALLRLAVTRDGDPFVWVLKMPTTGAHYESWYQSALDGATLAETEWTLLETNKGMGCYDINVAEGIKAEPQWPDLPFKEILRLCFKDRFIDSLDHPFLQRLRGEI